jgi:hypothetical protein
MSVTIWGVNGPEQVNDEQSLRIAEGVADFYASPEEYSFADLEDLFEDRDPCEFL